MSIVWKEPTLCCNEPSDMTLPALPLVVLVPQVRPLRSKARGQSSSLLRSPITVKLLGLISPLHEEEFSTQLRASPASPRNILARTQISQVSARDMKVICVISHHRRAPPPSTGSSCLESSNDGDASNNSKRRCCCRKLTS
jgi:hypothetical protein